MTTPRRRLVQISTTVLLLGAVVLDMFLFSDALVPYAEGLLGPTTDPGVVFACAALAWALLIVQRFARFAVLLTICAYSVVMSLVTSYTPVVVVCVALAVVTSHLSPRWSIVGALAAASTSVS